MRAAGVAVTPGAHSRGFGYGNLLPAGSVARPLLRPALSWERVAPGRCPGDRVPPSNTDLHYFHCLRIVEILKGTEASTKNLFGRYSSQRMKVSVGLWVCGRRQPSCSQLPPPSAPPSPGLAGDRVPL